MKKIALIAATLLVAGAAQAQTASPFYGEVGYVFLKADAGGAKANPSALRGFAGWDVHPNVALELMLAAGVSDDNYDGYITKVKVKSAYGLFVKPKYALNNQFELFGRLGFAQAKIKESDRIDGTVTSDDSSFAWGLGASYKFSKQWYGSMDYTSYYDKNSYKIDGFAVNVGYRF